MESFFLLIAIIASLFIGGSYLFCFFENKGRVIKSWQVKRNANIILVISLIYIVWFYFLM
jgi:hypothetical protein